MKNSLLGCSAITLLSFSATDALAQTAKPSADEAEEIIVTGTRTQGLRAMDSAAPIQVLGHDVLQRTGPPDLVQSLSVSLPSVQAENWGGDAAQFSQAFRLRGLSPNNTLVLVDGKRRHGTANLQVNVGPFNGSAAPDINFIPVSSIDHVEVLQDGAAAQYGSDAIAGVVNIILKKNSSGGNLQLTSGEYYSTGGLTTDLTGNLGLAPNDKSFLNISFETKWKAHSFAGDLDERVINTGTAANINANLLGRFPQLTSAPNYPYVNRWKGDAQVRLHTLTYNGGSLLSQRCRVQLT